MTEDRGVMSLTDGLLAMIAGAARGTMDPNGGGIMNDSDGGLPPAFSFGPGMDPYG